MNITRSLTPHDALRAMVKQTLRHHERHEWNLQGFGMLRTYLEDGWRLHVWNDDYMVPGVTLMHDHPWHFDSLLIAGGLANQRYCIAEEEEGGPATHMMRTITPGIGLATIRVDAVRIEIAGPREVYLADEIYHQDAHEIHVSTPFPGTITLVRRERVGEDVARSFHPLDKEWVSAEPRQATAEEVREICTHSLDTWFAKARP